MYVVGIDPGYGETGVVLLENETYVAGATFKSPTGPLPMQRSLGLSRAVVTQIVQWVGQYNIEDLLVGIETPIMNMQRNFKNQMTANVDAYSKQMRTIQEIEHLLWDVAREFQEEGTTIWLEEVGPTESKKLVLKNGNAGKDEIIAASPFTDRDDLARTVQEALADAWMHARAAWRKAWVNAHTMAAHKLGPMSEQHVKVKHTEVAD